MTFWRRSEPVDQRVTFETLAELESLIAEHVAPHLERAYVAGYRHARRDILGAPDVIGIDIVPIVS